MHVFLRRCVFGNRGGMESLSLRDAVFLLIAKFVLIHIYCCDERPKN